VFDADNAGIDNLIQQLESYRQAASPEATAALRAKATGPNPDAKAVFGLASTYYSIGQTNEAISALDLLLTNVSTKPEYFLSLSEAYRQLGRSDRMEAALKRQMSVDPSRVESWYDLATAQASQGKSAEAKATLKEALRRSDERLLAEPKATDLRKVLKGDPLLAPLGQP
jgi:predicted Zn-dependent protease